MEKKNRKKSMEARSGQNNLFPLLYIEIILLIV